MIRIVRSVSVRLRAHAEAALPHECCGILLGRAIDRETTVHRVIAAENIAEGDRRRTYQIDWRTLFETVRATRNGVDQIVGFYHSHPDGSARPSRGDRFEAWIDYVYVILSIADARPPGLTAWRIPTPGDPFVRQTVRVAEDGAPRGSVLTT
jgi:proteasome lid subunit RPN8/RPN11